MSTLSVIIPAYQEVHSIDAAIAETMDVLRSLGRPFELIVVDDGSTDGTAERVESLQPDYPGLRLIRHEQNQGKGAAIKTGVLMSGTDMVAFLDADLATTPDQLNHALALIEHADIVIGSRHHPKTYIVAAQPLLRALAGRMFAIAVRVIVGLPYQDTQCGFKVFGSRARSLFEQMQTTGWAFDVELLARARQLNLEIVEMPVTWQHGQVSRVKWTQAPGVLRELWRIRKMVN